MHCRTCYIYLIKHSISTCTQHTQPYVINNCFFSKVFAFLMNSIKAREPITKSTNIETDHLDAHACSMRLPFDWNDYVRQSMEEMQSICTTLSLLAHIDHSLGPTILCHAIEIQYYFKLSSLSLSLTNNRMRWDGHEQIMPTKKIRKEPNAANHLFLKTYNFWHIGARRSKQTKHMIKQLNDCTRFSDVRFFGSLFHLIK